MATDLKRLKARLVAARVDVEGRSSEHELELALEEIQAMWDELERQADQLLHERERSAALFELTPFACLVTDAYGNVRDANPAALALLEVPAVYLQGKPLVIFIAEKERESFRMHLATAAHAPGRPVETWRTRLTSSRGRPRDVRIDLCPLPADREKFLPLLWYLRDIE